MDRKGSVWYQDEMDEFLTFKVVPDTTSGGRGVGALIDRMCHYVKAGWGSALQLRAERPCHIKLCAEALAAEIMQNE